MEENEYQKKVGSKKKKVRSLTFMPEEPFSKKLYDLKSYRASRRKKKLPPLHTEVLPEEEINYAKIDKRELIELNNLLSIESVKKDIDDLKSSKGSNRYDQNIFTPTFYSDPSSFGVFYKKMHKIDEFQRKGVTSLSTPSFSFLKAARKISIVPNPKAFVKRGGEGSKILMSEGRLGDEYLKCLSEGLRTANHVAVLNLRKNRMSDASLLPLLKSIQEGQVIKRLFQIDFSYNNFGNAGYDAIAEYLNNYDCILEYFSCEGNLMGKRNALKIINAIKENLTNKMRYLNLGKNYLGDDIADDLSSLIHEVYYLEVLILFENQFRNRGAGKLMSEIKKHTRLKILDLSWNLIGNNLHEEIPSIEQMRKITGKEEGFFVNILIDQIRSGIDPSKKVSAPKNEPSYFTKELCDMFMNKEIKMVHLDISYNNINEKDAKYISEAVKNNHTILGIHVDGNDMTIDEEGFIFPLSKKNYNQAHFANSQIFYRIAETHPLVKSNVLNVQRIRGKNNCWICEGWKEVKFDLKPQTKEDLLNSNLKIYLNFEGYNKAHEAFFTQDSFTCHRMCPPGSLKYFTTLNDVPILKYENENIIKLKEAINFTQPPKEDEEDYDDEEKENKGPETFIIDKVIMKEIEINKEVINPMGYVSNLKYCIPRPEFIPKAKRKIRIPWTFPISIWAFHKYEYEGETEDVIQDAFEFDYNRGQYYKEKDLNNEGEKILKETLRGYYRYILDSYKNLSSYLGWRVPQVGQNQITEFASSCPDLLDAKYLINDVLVKVTEVKSNIQDKEDRKKTQKELIPDNIIRHQWMMLLFKVAKDKYFRTKQITNLAEAVKYTFEKHYYPYISQFNNHQWRLDRYYNEYTDNVIKAFIPIFNAVFMSNASQKVMGKESNWMALEEYSQLCNALMDDEFPVKEIPTLYNISMRTQNNEIFKDNHINMRFYEFLEAYCRFVDKLSPIPPGESKVDWPMERRAAQPLNVKLENIMSQFVKLITKSDYKNIRDKFIFPDKDEETGLYNIDYTNPMYNGLLPPPPKRTRPKEEEKKEEVKEDAEEKEDEFKEEVEVKEEENIIKEDEVKENEEGKENEEAEVKEDEIKDNEEVKGDEVKGEGEVKEDNPEIKEENPEVKEEPKDENAEVKEEPKEENAETKEEVKENEVKEQNDEL